MSLPTKHPSINYPITTRPVQSQTRKQWSSYHLLTLRKSIQDKLQGNSKIREQLKLQKQSSQKLLTHLHSSMLQTQNSGLQLVTRYEQQKCKHQHLSELVRHYQSSIESSKLLEHHNLINNIPTNQYDQLNLQLKQQQKLLQTITNKLNSFEAQKMSKYQVVKAERRERTVFSNQFNKFENQLFCLQEKYKQSVIERVLLEKTFQQKKDHFLKVQHDWSKQVQSLNVKERQERQSNQRNVTKKNQTYYREQHNEFYLDNLLVQPSFYRTRSKLNYMKMEKSQLTSKNQINQKKIDNLQYLKKIQLILNDLGLCSVQQIKSINCSKLNKNDDYFMKVSSITDQKQHQLQSIADQITQWTQQVQKVRLSIKNKPIQQKMQKHQRLKLHRNNQLKKIITHLSDQINQYNQQVHNFNSSQNLSDLISLLEIPSKTTNQNQTNQMYQFTEINTDKIDIKKMTQIQKQLFTIMGHLTDIKHHKPKHIHNRKSIFCQFNLNQSQQKDSSLIQTQRTICPLLQPTKVHNSKRMKTASSQQNNNQGIKKLSNLLRNQSRLKGPIDISSKDQMIRQATQAFDKEGILRQNKFQVKYS